MNKTDLFWENENLDLPLTESVWGERSRIFDKIIKYFPNNAKILDIGCGDGRNSIYLASLGKGFQITAVDISKNSLKRFENRIAHCHTSDILLINSDILDVDLRDNFDVVLVQGMIHFIEKYKYQKLFDSIKNWTKLGGYNLVSDFTNLIEFPEDIKEIFVSSLEVKELLEIYRDWNVILYEHYQSIDSHMGKTISHNHDVTRIFTQKLYE